jgi:hypothetical protein
MTVTHEPRLARGDSAPAPQASDPSSDSDAAARDETERHLRCRSCGAKVADPRSLFAASEGRVRHVFANPSGKVYEILTLLVAKGLLLYGSPTLEFTWFPGHAWRVALCAQCGTHLGWSFEAASQSATPPSFFGLLTSELVEDP